MPASCILLHSSAIVVRIRSVVDLAAGSCLWQRVCAVVGMSSEEVSGLLTSLAESAQFGPGIKLVFERSYFDSFPSTLQQSISVKDGRIRDICHAHYLEFLQSIDHLMAVKGEMEELRAQLRGLNGDVQSSAQQLLRAASAVNELRRQRLRLSDARDALRQGQQLLELTAKLTQQIHRRKFFAAVKASDPHDRSARCSSSLPGAAHGVCSC